MIAAAPKTRLLPIASPRTIADTRMPVTGTPNIAVDMVLAAKRVLAKFTAQKQKAVAKGPTKNKASHSVLLPSPEYRPSNIKATNNKAVPAKSICQGAK